MYIYTDGQASGFGGMEWWNELLEWNTGVPHLLPRLFEELRNSGTNIDGAEDRNKVLYYYSAYNVSGSYIGGTLLLLRTTIDIICWTEMVTISIV